MENKENFSKQAKNSLNNFMLFNEFVKNSEYFYQAPELCFNEEKQNNYRHIWFELEIINSLILSNWEEQRFSESWINNEFVNYKSELEELVFQLIKIVEQ